MRRIYALATATLLSAPTAESFAPYNQPIPQQALSDPTILQITALHDAPPQHQATPIQIIAPRKARTPKVVGTPSSPEPKTTITATLKSTSLLPDNANGSSQQSRKKMQRPALDSALKQKAARRSSDKNHGSSWPQYEPHTLLTAAQEREYAFRIRTFRAAVKLRDSLVSFQDGVYIHPTESQWAAACGTSVADLHRLVEEGQDARAVLVSSNIGLVVNQAKRHFAGLKSATEADGGVGTILTMSDMIQEGNLGLMEAAERFEPEKGFRFSTYATYWVRQRIRRSISDSSRIIRLPAYVHDMLQKIRRAKVEMKAETGREPNLTELAHYMEISEERLRLYTASSRNVVSLERPIANTGSFKSHEDHRTLYDTLASDAPSPEEDAVHDSMRRDLRAVMDTELAGVERQVLVHRFGLENAQQPLSVTETAAALAISIDRVRLVEARALNKLRHPMRNYKLKEYVVHAGPTTQVADERPAAASSSSSSSSPNQRTNQAWFQTMTKESLEETFARSPTETKSEMWFF
jgi:RNA polymerase primary sigma factor